MLGAAPKIEYGFRVDASSKRVRADDRSWAGGTTHGNEMPLREGRARTRGGVRLTLGTVCIFAGGSSSTRRGSKGRSYARWEKDRQELLSWEATEGCASFPQDIIVVDARAFSETWAR